MKISQMTTNQASDALVKISAYAANILDDKDMMALIKDTGDKGVSDAASGWNMLLTRFVPMCLKTHREDLFAIIGALDNKAAEEVGKLKMIETLNILRDSVDKELLDFFGSFIQQGKTETK